MYLDCFPLLFSTAGMNVLLTMHMYTIMIFLWYVELLYRDVQHAFDADFIYRVDIFK